MRTFVTASKDASIYEEFSTVNTGLDEILDIGKIVRDLNYGAVRSLLQFEIPDGLPPDKVYLNLRLASADNLKSTETLEVWPVSQSWVQGTGYYYQRVWNASDGVTWDYRVTGSDWNTAGGDVLSVSGSSVSLDTFPIGDLRIDVTDMILAWSGSGFPNHGFMVKLDDATEADVNDQAIIRVFSKQTHTIYQPLLEFCWATQSIDTGSLIDIPSTVVEIAPTNLSPAYTKGEIRKLYFNVRDKYPRKAYDGLQRYRNLYYLPQDTQFELKDAQSGLVVIPFDEYSTLDTDPSGSYVTINTSPLERYRFYTLTLKVPVGDEILYTNPIRMKVI